MDYDQRRLMQAHNVERGERRRNIGSLLMKGFVNLTGFVK